MITLTQSEGRAILRGAEQLLKSELDRGLISEIFDRYDAINDQLFIPSPDGTSEENVKGYETLIELDFPLFPFSMLPARFVGAFLLGPMGKLFDRNN